MQSDTEKDSFVAVFSQRSDRKVPTQTHIALEFDSHRQYRVDLGLDQFTRQAVNGHTGRQHTAGLVVGLENGDLIAELNEVMSDRQAGNTGADDGDPFAVALFGRQHFGVAAVAIVGEITGLRPVFLIDEPLEGADRDRCIERTASAISLAGCAAYSSADGCEGVCRPSDLIGVEVAALGDRRYIAACVGMDRAGVLTLDHLHPIVSVLLVGQFEL